MDNKKNGLDLTERYLYAVTKRLPKEQRSDIEKELRGLIEDMLAEKTAGNEPSQKDIEAVLLELGKPAELAAKYRGTKNYLIGPDYFGLYMMVLKIVLAAVAGGLTIALSIGFIAGARENIFATVGNYFSTVISALFQAFGWVTVIFALMQKYNAKIDKEDIDWNPKELPEVPQEKARIKKSEPIAGIIFTVLAMLIFNAVPEIFAFHWVAQWGGTWEYIPVFDMKVFMSMLPLINVIFALGIVKEISRLIIEKYNLTLAVIVTTANIISLVITLYVFAAPIWNAEFITQMQAVQGLEMPTDFDLSYYWNRVPWYFGCIAVFGFVVDTLTTIVKGIRYSIAGN